MAMLQLTSGAVDPVMMALISGLEIEFGRGAAEGLAQRFLAAEECDLHWNARIAERWIGCWNGETDAAFELDRIEILGRIAGHWFVAICVVDGEGSAHGLLANRRFKSRRLALEAFETPH